MTSSRKPSGPVSASELIAQLDADPEHQRRVQELEAERKAHRQELRRAQRPIIEELQAIGVAAKDSIWDLIMAPEPDLKALPVLLEHLERGGYPDDVMESLGQGLAVKQSLKYWDRLKALYLNASSPAQADGAAIAMIACATKAQLDDMISFLSLEERGESRIYFLRPINRLGRERGRQIIDELRDDPVLGEEARAIAARRRK